MSNPRILIADDEPDVLNFLRNALGAEAWAVEMVEDGREALNRLCNKPFDVAVLDLKMPHLDGIEVLKAIKEKGISTDVLILTGHGTIQTAVLAMKMGAADFVTKPFHIRDFKAAIRTLLERRHPESDALPERLDAYLNIHAFNASLKLEDLCSHFQISSRYVSRLFKEHFGMSFRRRLALYRLERAKELLRSTDDPLYRIAERCGFRDYRHLTKTFQRLEKMPPRAYRTANRGKQGV